MTVKKLITSGSPYEKSWGYSRAVVFGNEVFVSGTTGFDYATMTIHADVGDQTRTAFSNIEKALAEAGASLADVVRIRYYVAHPGDWEAIGEAAGGILADVRPAASALICALVDPRMKVEIEVDARIGFGASKTS